jgi:hypothetical protein
MQVSGIRAFVRDMVGTNTLMFIGMGHRVRIKASSYF